MRMARALALTFSATVYIAACRHRLPSTSLFPPNENAYIDLAAGKTLSITVPSLKDGRYIARMEPLDESVATNAAVEMRSDDVIGFQISKCSIGPWAAGKIRLKFKSTEVTRYGKTPSTCPIQFCLSRCLPNRVMRGSSLLSEAVDLITTWQSQQLKF